MAAAFTRPYGPAACATSDTVVLTAAASLRVDVVFTNTSASGATVSCGVGAVPDVTNSVLRSVSLAGNDVLEYDGLVLALGDKLWASASATSVNVTVSAVSLT